MPELIKEGKVYWAQFPLYEVTLNNKLIFAYDDEELAQIISKNPNAKYVRNKGLGEMDSDAFAEAAFGENARLIQFTMEDAEEAVYMLELLLGMGLARITASLLWPPATTSSRTRMIPRRVLTPIPATSFRSSIMSP